MRTIYILIALIFVFGMSLSEAVAQDDGNDGDNTEVSQTTTGTTTTATATIIIRGRRLNPGQEPIRCDPRYPDDTCAVVKYVWPTTATRAVQDGQPTVGLYVPADQRGYVDVRMKVAYNYKEVIISVERSEDSKEVYSEQEIDKYYLRPRDDK